MKSDLSHNNNKFDYRNVPLHEWFATSEEKKKQEHFEDQDSFYKAYQVLIDINEVPKVKEDMICENRRVIEKIFTTIEFSINNNQLATAMVLSSMLADNNRLLCQMGAGKGKSRVIAALALLYLKASTKDIYIVYLNDSLKKRDMK